MTRSADVLMNRQRMIWCVAAAILIPVIGPLVGFIVTLLGAGAVLVTLWPRRQQPDSTAAAGYDRAVQSMPAG